MTKNHTIKGLGVTILVAMGLFGTRSLWAGGEGSDCCPHGMTDGSSKLSPSSPQAKRQTLNDKSLAILAQAIDSAIRNLKAGKTAAALDQLKMAKALIEHLQTSARTSVPKTASAPAPKAKFINAHCPILGTKIDSDKVPDNLIREYKGRKVAFCCDGCPEKWDKLTDIEKEAKLRKATDNP